MEQVRSVKEIAADRAKLVAEAEALQTKHRTETLSAEEDARLEECLSAAEALAAEEKTADREERISEAKARMAAPIRQPVHVPAVITARKSDTASVGEAMAAWFEAHSPNGDRSAGRVYRARSAGFDIGNRLNRVPVNYRGLNYRERTILSKTAVGAGAEYITQTYSDKVVEYLTLTSPLLGFLPNDVTSDGDVRTYFKVDDTAMMSSYTSNSGGTETIPTIPEANIVTANIAINVFEITSGAQKLGHKVLRDSWVSLEDKVAKANGHAHARRIENDILNGSGNGVTGVQGLNTVATPLTGVSAWSQDALQDALNAIPSQYRANALFVSNDATKQAVNKSLRDDLGRSLFDKTVDQGQEFDTLFGKKYIVSNYMPANTVLVFVPQFYQMRTVEGQIFKQLTEVYFPNIAWVGLMEFGGAWIGPANCAYTVTKS